MSASADERNELLSQTIRLQNEVLRDRARSGKLLAFTLATKPDYQTNWHHFKTAYYLNKFLRREIRRLIILEPPRHGKSELSSRRLPPLIHGIYPNDEILAFSYNGDLASDMTIDVQRIMDQEIYQNIFPLSKITPPTAKSNYARSSVEHELIPVEDNPKIWRPPGLTFDKNRGFIVPRGSYRASGVGGSFTGRGGNWLLGDDPIKNREDADSKVFRDMLWDFFRSTARTRLEKDACICITMTHWHRDDIVGRIQELMKFDPLADKYEILRLPAIKENDDAAYDPRKVGEALWPDKYDIKELLATKATIGSRNFAALYQQNPVTEGGNIIQSKWFKFYKQAPTEFDEQVQSWDFAVKDKDDSSYTVGQVWGRVGANKYLLDQVRGKWSFPKACAKLVELSERWPNARKKFVEDKANGPAVIASLKEYVTGLVEVDPKALGGDKTARLNAVAPDFESENVWVPNPEQNPWVQEFIDEVCDFPAGTYADQVDTMTQALIKMRKRPATGSPIAGHGSGIIY
jgi:predicted phage terminase large subunit-like protein